MVDRFVIAIRLAGGMFVMPTANGPGPSGVRRRDRTRVCCLLLATALAVSTGPGHAETLSTPSQAATPSAEARPADELEPLEHLAGTIGDLTARLSAIRQDLAALHAASPPPEVDAAPPDPAQRETRIALLNALEELRARIAAERAEWRHAKAAMTGELTGLRERLAAADGALAELRRDREALVRHITLLDAQVQKARTRELVDALVETQRPAIEPAEAPPAASLMRVTPSAFAAEPPPALAGARRDLVRAGSRLDLQAELALAQLRIAELTTALDAAQLREQAIEAEAASLRSLTEAQIRRFMGQE
jgi:hypothetical protein